MMKINCNYTATVSEQDTEPSETRKCKRKLNENLNENCS